MQQLPALTPHSHRTPRVLPPLGYPTGPHPLSLGSFLQEQAGGWLSLMFSQCLCPPAVLVLAGAACERDAAGCLGLWGLFCSAGAIQGRDSRINTLLLSHGMEGMSPAQDVSLPTSSAVPRALGT